MHQLDRANAASRSMWPFMVARARLRTSPGWLCRSIEIVSSRSAVPAIFWAGVVDAQPAPARESVATMPFST